MYSKPQKVTSAGEDADNSETLLHRLWEGGAAAVDTAWGLLRTLHAQ